MATILVTGASSGLGAACAARLARAGPCVIGTSRGAVFPPQLKDGDMAAAPLDVRRDESVEALAAFLERENRMPQGLVLNAGYSLAGAVEDTSAALAEEQFQTNFFGVHRCVRAFLPAMRARRAGTILIMGSMAGRIGVPFQAFYSASKFALEGYAESLRHEVRPFGVKVGLIEPGDFKTGIEARRPAHALSAGSSYRVAFESAMAAAEDGERAGADPKIVAALAERLFRIGVKNLRYPVGKTEQRLLLWLKPAIPPRAFERLVAKTFRLKTFGE